MADTSIGVSGYNQEQPRVCFPGRVLVDDQERGTARGGRIGSMKKFTMHVSAFGCAILLLMLTVPALAQVDGKPETDSPRPAVEVPESDPADQPDDVFPIDIDPLDILDSADPLGKIGSLVDEISRNMKEIESLLEEDDTSEGTQMVQQQTLSRIDELITEVQRLTGT
jgi:hypothetical protein